MSRSKKNLLLVALSCIVAFCASVALAVSGNTARAYADTPLVENAGVENVSLTLADDLVIKYYVPTASLTDDTTATFTMNGVNTDVEGVVEGENYVFAYGVTPQYVGTAIDMSVTESIYVKNYSIKAYCEAILAEQPATVADAQYGYLKELAVDILNYGAAAQTYVDFDVDNLANKDLGENAALATEYGADLKSVANLEGAGEATWQNVGLYCDSALALYFEIQVPDIQKEYTLKVNGDAANVELESKAGDVYTYIYTGVTPVKFADSVTAQLFDGENAVSGVVTYSVNSYVSAMKESQTAGLADLVKAVYGYGKMAYAYVNYASFNNAVVDPTETKAGSVTVTGGKYVYDVVELPVLNITDYNYTGTTVTDGVAKGTFTLKDTSKTTWSKEVEIAHYITVFGTNYTIYNNIPDWVKTSKEITQDGYIAKFQIDRDFSWNDLTIGGTMPVEFWAEANEGANDTLTINNPIIVNGQFIIGENLNVKSAHAGDAVQLYGNLVVNGGLEATVSDGNQWQCAIRYQAENASMIVNGMVNFENKGIGVYLNHVGNSFTVNDGANVTVNTYGHGIAGSGAQTALTINGGTFSVTGSTNAILCDTNFDLTTTIKGGTVTLNGNVQSQNIAIHGGEITGNRTLKVDKLVVKGGTLTSTISNDEPGIQSLNSGAETRYYFFGGEVSVKRTISQGYGGIFSWGAGNKGVVAVGGHAKVSFSGFSYGIIYAGANEKLDFYELTAYDKESDEGDKSTTYGIITDNCGTRLGRNDGATEYGVWDTVLTTGYMAHLGITVNSVDELKDQALSAESVAGAVNFANL